MADIKVLMAELQKYKELEKRAEGTTLEKLVQIYEDDILQYGQNTEGIRIMSDEDYEYYTELMEEKSKKRYDEILNENYKKLEEQLSIYNTDINDIVQEYLNNMRGKEE